MKRGWQVATVALLVLFALFAYESLQLSLHDALGPGPGFFPFWLSVLGGILGALLVQLKLGRAALAGELSFERIAVPRGTPEPIVKKLQEVFKKAMDDPEHVKKMEEAGLQLRIMVGEEYQKYYRDLHAKAAKYTEWVRSRPHK